MKFYKRDPDRALSGMYELTLKQRGAYNSILDLLYSRDGDVDDDDLRVSKMIGCNWREWKVVKEELIGLGKLWLEGGKIRAKRVQETIKEAADFGQDQSRRAAKGWEKRKNANENNDGVMPTGNANTPIDTPIDTPRINPSVVSPSPKPDERKYFFAGRVIRLTHEDAARWRENYPLVPDLRAELEAADSYYATNAPKNGNWFFAVSNWLKKANAAVQEKREEERRARRSFN